MASKTFTFTNNTGKPITFWFDPTDDNTMHMIAQDPDLLDVIFKYPSITSKFAEGNYFGQAVSTYYGIDSSDLVACAKPIDILSSPASFTALQTNSAAVQMVSSQISSSDFMTMSSGFGTWMAALFPSLNTNVFNSIPSWDAFVQNSTAMDSIATSRDASRYLIDLDAYAFFNDTHNKTKGGEVFATAYDLPHADLDPIGQLFPDIFSLQAPLMDIANAIKTNADLKAWLLKDSLKNVEVCSQLTSQAQYGVGLMYQNLYDLPGATWGNDNTMADMMSDLAAYSQIATNTTTILKFLLDETTASSKYGQGSAYNGYLTNMINTLGLTGSDWTKIIYDYLLVKHPDYVKTYVVINLPLIWYWDGVTKSAYGSLLYDSGGYSSLSLQYKYMDHGQGKGTVTIIYGEHKTTTMYAYKFIDF